ncbi:ATPase [Romboutsia maritimum]|uniref:ATPase n=1 Tax=Romboutsia maritimum TaxID=2020948 RepID=A0A371IU35_9FIRM|nr:ATPase [Romboutsia maritimum]RDY23975.1 ATPase [Romboutsia maritimum]
MIKNNSKSQDEFYNYILQYLNKYVEVYTYFSNNLLYGKVIEVTPFYITISNEHTIKNSSSNSEISTFYLPLNSIISIKKL